MVFNCHKAVQCDQCELWIHNECFLISQSEYEALENSNCTWIRPKCEMINFSDFDTQCNLESPNRFEPLVKKANEYRNPNSTNGLKFASININSIREKTGTGSFS